MFPLAARFTEFECYSEVSCRTRSIFFSHLIGVFAELIPWLCNADSMSVRLSFVIAVTHGKGTLISLEVKITSRCLFKYPAVFLLPDREEPPSGIKAERGDLCQRRVPNFQLTVNVAQSLGGRGSSVTILTANVHTEKKSSLDQA